MKYVHLLCNLSYQNICAVKLKAEMTKILLTTTCNKYETGNIRYCFPGDEKTSVHMMVQTQNAGGLQDLQVSLVWDGLVQGVLGEQWMWPCLTTCFLWGSRQISLCKLVLFSAGQWRCPTGLVVSCMTLHLPWT